MFIPNKRGTGLETKLFEVRHMTRLNLYLGLPKSTLKPVFLNVYIWSSHENNPLYPLEH